VRLRWTGVFYATSRQAYRRSEERAGDARRRFTSGRPGRTVRNVFAKSSFTWAAVGHVCPDEDRLSARSRIPAAASSPAPRQPSVTTTDMSERAAASAMAFPIPDALPVTMITLLFSHDYLVEKFILQESNRVLDPVRIEQFSGHHPQERPFPARVHRRGRTLSGPGVHSARSEGLCTPVL